MHRPYIAVIMGDAYFFLAKEEKTIYNFFVVGTINTWS